MNEENKRGCKKTPLIIYLFYLMVVVFVMTGVTLSQYVFTVSGTADVRVAVMATDVTVSIDTDTLISPGEESVLPIVVTNKKGNSICEVEQSYTSTIELLEGNIPLEWNIYKDAECTEMVSDMSGALEAGVESSDDYFLKVKWVDGSYSESYSFEVDALVIKFTSEQLD